MNWIFVKIWNWGVENHCDYHGLQYKWFCSWFDNIIIDHEKKKHIKIN
jgi:hypothetical protein